ncbi:MAG: HAMP domain-containing sensor histidine kinase [Planctomycetota bacterium]
MALLGLAGIGLWRGSREAEQRAQWQAQRDAEECARALRAALGAPEVLAHCAAEQRFTVVDGHPVVDADVAWLESQPAGDDPLLRERLRQARVAEFVAHDADAAARAYDALLLEPNVDVLLRAAWQAKRAGCDPRCRELRERAREALGELRDEDLRAEATAAMLASLVLLDAANGQGVNDPTLRLLAHAPTAIAAPTLRRLAELSPDDQTISAALDEHLRIAARRALLRRAAAFVRDDAFRGSPQRLGDQLVLWFPTGDGGATAGEGAIVPPTWLATLLGHDDASLPPVPARGALRDTPTPDAEPPLLGADGEALAWIAPLPPAELPWFGRPTLLLGIGGALLLLFAASAWATLRGLSRASAAMRARTDFLTGVTHELKTPIAAMRLIADVLHDDEVAPAQQQRYLEMLAGESARLTTLIDNVLDLGQIERGERAYDLQPDCAADAVRETVHGYEAIATHHGLALTLHEGLATAPAVLDRGALGQALRNLLENARKYAAAGGRIEVHTERRGDTFAVRVRDFGPGVPEPEREAIFDRFVRGRRQQHGSVPGVGLGLFLSREIARRHGGDLVHVPTAEGTGATFELTLPLSPQP